MPQTSALTTTTNETVIEIYRQTVSQLYRYISRRTAADRSLTEDITQETYLRALHHWQRRPIPPEPLPFLYTIARNIITNHYRKKHPTTITPDQWQSFIQQNHTTTPDQTLTDTTNTNIQNALTRINKDQARLLTAFHLDQRSTKELAQEYRLTEKAIERRLARARAALQKKLAPAGVSNQ